MSKATKNVQDGAKYSDNTKISQHWANAFVQILLNFFMKLFLLQVPLKVKFLNLYDCSLMHLYVNYVWREQRNL